VVEPTLDALLVMESQIHEGGANGYAGLYPEDETGVSGAARRFAEILPGATPGMRIVTAILWSNSTAKSRDAKSALRKPSRSVSMAGNPREMS
jgi:hypothetical protein